MSEIKYCMYCGQLLQEKIIDGHLRKACKICHEIHYENPVPAVCMLITNAHDEILLVKRNQPPGKGLWCLPGGFMELNETPVQTGLRELKEETGLTGKINTLIGVDSSSHEDYHTVTLSCFHCRYTTGDIIAGDDADEAGFFKRTELPEIAFDTHIRFIRIYFAGYTSSNM